MKHAGIISTTSVGALDELKAASAGCIIDFSEETYLTPDSIQVIDQEIHNFPLFHGESRRTIIDMYSQQRVANALSSFFS